LETQGNTLNRGGANEAGEGMSSLRFLIIGESLLFLGHRSRKGKWLGGRTTSEMPARC